MKGYFAGIILCLMILLLLPFVSAAYISLQMTAETNDTEGTITVKHLGDETAYQVQVVSRILDNTYESEIRDELRVGDNFSTTLPINLRNHSAGTYPLLVTIHYQDRNGYLFSTLISKLVKNVVQTRSEITLELSSAEIVDAVKVPVAIKNFGEENKDVRLFLFMSDEFVVKNNNHSISLAPKSNKDVVFEVENFGARANSNYTFYVIAEYDEQEEHYGVIGSGQMRVLQKKKDFFDSKIIIIALAVIGIIFIVMQFMKRK